MSWDWIDWLWESSSWARLAGALALAGSVAAAATFIVGRLDRARSDADRLYVKVTEHLAGPPGPGDDAFTKYQIVNNGALPASRVGVSAWTWGRRRITWRVRRSDNLMTGTYIAGRVYPTIFPGESTEVHDLPGVWVWGPPGELPPVMLIFRDGLSRRWVRWPDGKLTRFAPCRAQRDMWARDRKVVRERRGERES